MRNLGHVTLMALRCSNHTRLKSTAALAEYVTTLGLKRAPDSTTLWKDIQCECNRPVLPNTNFTPLRAYFFHKKFKFSSYRISFCDRIKSE